MSYFPLLKVNKKNKTRLSLKNKGKNLVSSMRLTYKIVLFNFYLKGK